MTAFNACLSDVGKRDMAKRSKNQDVVFLPAEAIKSLRMELENVVGDKLSSGVLFRFGYRCGEALVEKKVASGSLKSGLEAAITDIWKQIGLGRLAKIEEVSAKEMEIELRNSTEAKVVGTSTEPSCDFTRGYLAGIVSKITKRKFYCLESECESVGEPNCRFQLMVFPHRVYIPKKSQKDSRSRGVRA